VQLQNALGRNVELHWPVLNGEKDGRLGHAGARHFNDIGVGERFGLLAGLREGCNIFCVQDGRNLVVKFSRQI
jgi:hypothetical protein